MPKLRSHTVELLFARHRNCILLLPKPGTARAPSARMKSNLSSPKVIVALAAVMALSACSQTKQLEEMHDSTASMDATTKTMNSNLEDTNTKMGGMDEKIGGMATQMGGMNERMESMDGKMGSMDGKMTGMNAGMQELKDLTSGLCHGSSQALPLQARQMTLNQMDRATSGNDKVAWAVTYVMGFDFQAWPLCNSSEGERDLMMDDAIQEFFHVMHRYDSGRKMPNPFVVSAAEGADAQDLAFNLMSVALSYANRQQLEHKRKNPTAPVYTFLSIMKESLTAGAQVDAGKRAASTLKPYQSNLLANKEMAVRLLQARQSASLAIVLGFAKDAKSAGVGNLVSLINNRYLSGLTGAAKWNFEIDRWNSSQLQMYGKFLEDALDARAFLRSIGVKPVLNTNLAALVDGMTPVVSSKATKAKTTPEFNAFLQKLKKVQTEI
jgi:hypothetical protein